MMKETYKSMQEQIRPDEVLIERTLAAAELRPKRKPILKYTGIAAAAACLAMVGSVPVLAQNVPAFYHALYKVAPETAERFKPLEMISESNGIRMEVGGIYFHENTVEAYITMQDLEGDRLGDWIGFCSVSSLIPDLSIFEERMNGSIQKHELSYAGYDAETKTLTLLLSIEFLTGELQQGDEVTLNLVRLLGNHTQWDGTLDMVDWKPAGSDAEFCDATEMHIYGGVSEEIIETYAVEERMLKPTMNQPLPAEGVIFTGTSYQDGLLRTQLYIDDLKLNNDGVIWLEKADGTEVYSIVELQGCEDRTKMNDLTACWKEFVFAVGEEELEEYSLKGIFWRYNDMVEGDWSVTFTLPEEE